MWYTIIAVITRATMCTKNVARHVDVSTSTVYSSEVYAQGWKKRNPPISTTLALSCNYRNFQPKSFQISDLRLLQRTFLMMASQLRIISPEVGIAGNVEGYLQGELCAS